MHWTSAWMGIGLLKRFSYYEPAVEHRRYVSWIESTLEVDAESLLAFFTKGRWEVCCTTANLEGRRMEIQ